VGDEGRPSAEVVAAFGGDASTVIDVGRGASGIAWRAGPVVLERGAGTDEELSLWHEVAAAFDAGAPVRLAAPVPAVDGSWRVDGWAATTWLDGRSAARGEWAEVLDASDALHAVLASIAVAWPPSLVRDDPWAIADREAWKDGADAGRRQIVHGDIAGNVVLLDGARPGVLDAALYHRPAAWARAVAVADLVAWWGAPPELLEDVEPDLLDRACTYRLVVAARRREPHGDDRVLELTSRR
jgi:hypothetical protein